MLPSSKIHHRQPSRLECVHGHCFLNRCFCKPGFTGVHCEHTTSHPPPACAPKSDECYATQEAGIAVVDHQRWIEQQRYELEFWRRRPDHVEDNASPAAERFKNYAELPRNLGDVIEVGCGPFTQLSTILNKTGASASTVTLLDPLLIKYFRTSPNSPYRGADLPEEGTHGLSFHGLPTTLVQAPAEYMNKFSQQFDTVVMLNVLEHVTNAFTILSNIHNALRPNGILVFHERIYDRNNATRDWNPGHPVRLKSGVFNHFLSYFDTLYEVRTTDEPIELCADGHIGLYYIGRKRSHTPTDRCI